MRALPEARGKVCGAGSGTRRAGQEFGSGERYDRACYTTGLPCMHTVLYTRGGAILYQPRGAILRDASGQVITVLLVLWPERGWWRRGERRVFFVGVA